MGRHGTRTINSLRLSVNLPKELVAKLDEYCQEKGQTKTVATERILTDFFWKREQDLRNQSQKEAHTQKLY